MSLEHAILEPVRALPAEKQQEVLNHAAKLRDEAGRKNPFKSVRGLWADLGVSLSSEEIEENRRDMWQNFPRRETSERLLQRVGSASYSFRGRCEFDANPRWRYTDHIHDMIEARNLIM